MKCRKKIDHLRDGEAMNFSVFLPSLLGGMEDIFFFYSLHHSFSTEKMRSKI
jgi:hypothetical protein